MAHKYFSPVIALALLFTGCSIYTVLPNRDVKGEKVVCILHNDTRFKTEVVKTVSNSLVGKGYSVVTGRVKNAKFINPADYGAMVYMTELWAWHTPWHSVRYFNKHDGARNIIFVITSGDPDAVTSASNPEKIPALSKEIIDRLGTIL